MYRESIGADLPAANMEFAFDTIVGRWKSMERVPDVRVYRSAERKNGGFFLEFAYKGGDVFRRPLKQYYGIRYFNLYGFIGLAYDAENDVLQISGYGDYYRVED